MPSVRMLMLGILAVVLLSACGSIKLGGSAGSKSGAMCQCDAHAEQDLAQGVKSYEDGDYTAATAMLQHALQDGLANKSQANAHKYLAFIHCVSKRERQCNDEFKKALEADPDFNLQSAEAGHPVWGPVFRSVKGSKSAQ